MKAFYTFLCVLGGTLLSGFSVPAQDAWPKTVTTAQGTVIKLYQWQPESFSGNSLQAKAAISVLESGKTDPVFGMTWIKATTSSNGSRVQVEQAHIESIKLPGEESNDKLDEYAAALEQHIGQGGIGFAQSDLQSSLNLNTQQTQLSQQISNTPPKVLYSNTPSILVLIDGAPKLQRNSEWGVDAVVNTPFTIIKNNDGRFYLYGGKHWYTAASATGPYSLTTQVTSNMERIAQQVNDASKDDGAQKETDENQMYKIVVSTEPAELIQSKGEANFAPVAGTELLYVSNSEDDIFMDTQSQQYYVLISGRWYKSKTLSGQWQFVASDKLPQDFARIEEGSPKDNVLASVAGTEASQEALQEAEIPQTARVDRQRAKADVIYDGDPQFEDIDGTDMDYAVNTSASVIRWRGRYYSVDNGIWFESYSASGPWMVATVRPAMVALIPPRYPVYNMKYVYIYDVTPDYVWMGYTPGYLNTYIYGPTIVYGTGYYYRPWYGHYYFPRPYTWGFNIRYNPWFGWGFGFNYSAGWFHASAGFGRPWGYGYGGWWGPRVYRPSYCYSPYRTRGGYYGGGYYSNGYRSRTQVNIVQINRTNNIYNYRGGRGVVTRDNQRVVVPNRGGREFNRQGYANRNYNNSNGNRSSRFDNNNGRQSNDIRPGAGNNNGGRIYRRPESSNRDNNNRFGNNNRPRPADNNGVQRPNREYRPIDNNRGGDGNRTPGTITQPRTRERVIRDNNGGSRDDNRWNNRNNNPAPVNREPRVIQPRSNNDNRQWQNRPGGAERPGRVIQPQQPQQRQVMPAPQPRQQSQPRSFERRDNDGGNRGGGNPGGSSRPARGGNGEQNGGGERPGRRG